MSITKNSRIIVSILLIHHLLPLKLSDHCQQLNENNIEKINSLPFLKKIPEDLKKKLNIFFDNELIEEENLSKVRNFGDFVLGNKIKFFKKREKQILVPKEERKNSDGTIYVFQDEKNQKNIGVKEIKLDFGKNVNLKLEFENVEKSGISSVSEIFDQITKIKEKYNDENKFLEFYTCFFSYEIKKLYLVQEEIKTSFIDKYPTPKNFRDSVEKKDRIKFYKSIFQRFNDFFEKNDTYSWFHIFYPKFFIKGKLFYEKKTDIYLKDGDLNNFKIVNYDKLKIFRGKYFGYRQIGLDNKIILLNEDAKFCNFRFKDCFSKYNCVHQNLPDENENLISIVANIIYLEYGEYLKFNPNEEIIGQNKMKGLKDYDDFRKKIIKLDNDFNGINQTNEKINERVLETYNTDYDIIFDCIENNENISNYYRDIRNSIDSQGTEEFQKLITEKLLNIDDDSDTDKLRNYKFLIGCYINKKYEFDNKGKENPDAIKGLDFTKIKKFNEITEDFYLKRKENGFEKIIKGMKNLEYIKNDLKYKNVSPLAENLIEFILKNFVFDKRRTPHLNRIVKDLDNILNNLENLEKTRILI